MSIEKMKLATLVGPLQKFDTAVQTCLINHEFQPDNALSSLSDSMEIQPFETRNPYKESLSKAAVLSEKLGINLAYHDFDQSIFSTEKSSKYMDDLSSTILELEEKRKVLLLEVSDNEQIIEHLRHIQNIGEDISIFFTMQYTIPRFGRIPIEVYTDMEDAIMAKTDFFFFLTSLEADYAYSFYFTLPKLRDSVDTFFKSLHFEPIWISSKISGTPEEAIENMLHENLKLKHQADDILGCMRHLGETECENFLITYSYLRFMHDTYEFRNFAGHTSDSFFIAGWVPDIVSEKLENETDNMDGLFYIPPDENDLATLSPPIKRKMNAISKIFSPFLEMYGLPSYNEIDPGLFLGLTYTLMFGMMFGDVGQGLILIIVGWLLFKFKGMWLGRIISFLGISAVLFGFVYGSVFGYENLLPGFNVLEEGNTTTALIVAVAVGIVLILMCMAMNIINGIRQKDIGKIFFSANGIAGNTMYFSTVVAAAVYLIFDINLFVLPYVLPLIILPLLIMFAKDPLTKLCKGDKNWKPESFGMFFMEGFFEVFEALLSFVSNTVSFLRVGALTISHAGMMLTVFLLANEGSNIFVMIIGNIIVIGLETFLSCIQVLRLEFYELFGRFYESGGKSFSPAIIDYSSPTV